MSDRRPEERLKNENGYIYERSRRGVPPDILQERLAQFDDLGADWQARNVPEFLFDLIAVARGLVAAVRRGVESGTIEGRVEKCPRCDGNGYEVVEHIRVVPEHHPSCVGGSECASTCPVPVPHPEYEREACPACGGLGSYLLIPVDGVSS